MSESERQDVLSEIDPSVREMLRQEPKSRRKKPQYPSEKKRKRATYDCPLELQARVQVIARKLGVTISVAHNALLEDAVSRCEDGELEFEVVPDPRHKTILA